MRIGTALLIALAVTGCEDRGSQSQNLSPPASLDVTEPPPANEPPPAAARPQIAYTYSLGYDLAGDALPAVQARHVALCTGLGAGRCRVANTRLSAGAEPGTANATAVFLIDARLAGPFLSRLDRTAQSAGGRVATRTTAGEDLTKQIVDTDARVRAKQALADRLVALIRTQRANVGELVQAERAYADTQEELDGARQLAAALRGRVAMSEVTVEYSSGRAVGAWRPISASMAAAGETLGASIAALVTFLVAALPWALLVAPVVWIGRRRGWRVRLRRARTDPAV